MSQYSLKVARKYHFVTGCKEHQSLTYLESNGYDMRPFFYNDFHNVYSLIDECLRKGDFLQHFEEEYFWNKARSLYGIEICTGNIQEESFNSVYELYDKHKRPFFVSGDSFFIPYSPNYRKESLGTRLSILGVTESGYTVGDSQNYLITEIEREILDEAVLKGEGANGHYCVPYFGENMDSLDCRIPNIQELLRTHAEHLLQQRVADPENDVILDVFLQSRNIYDPGIIPKLNECFIAWYAAWQKTKMFLGWCREQCPDVTIEPKLMERLDKLITGWQRVQIEYNKGAQQHAGHSEKLKDKLLNIRQLEAALLAEHYSVLGGY